MSVVDKDTGYGDLLRAFGDLGEPAVYVGVRGESDSDLLIYAGANEFGTEDGHVPERSYLRSTADEKQEEYAEHISKGLGRVIDGTSSIGTELGRVGQRAVRDVQRKIVALKDPPNAPSTIAKKGSSNPLVDEGRLRQSIDYLVEEG